MRTTTILTLLVSLALIPACTRQLSPQEVADRFWRAVVTGHPMKIKRYVRLEQRDSLDGEVSILPVSSFRLGRIVIDGETANIETEIALAGETPLDVTIHSRLVLEQQQWRIDYDATVAEIAMQSNLARVIEKISKVGETLKQGVEQSIDEMTNVLPAIEEELSRIESEIKQRIPELREQLEAFSKRLEEALGAPPGRAQPDATGEGTIAL